MTSVVTATAETEAGHSPPAGPSRYGRMFPGLAPLVTDPRLLTRAGGHSGICDAAAVPGPSGDDAAESAGWPFFGQLIAHDVTADRSSITGGLRPGALRNARAPKLDLEMLYSDGSIGSPSSTTPGIRRSSCSAALTVATCRGTSRAWR